MLRKHRGEGVEGETAFCSACVELEMPLRHLIKVARKLPGVGWGETGTGGVKWAVSMCVGKVTGQ